MFIDWKSTYVQMSHLPNLIYRFNTLSDKHSSKLFVDIDEVVVEFIWKDSGPRIAQNSTEGKDERQQT